MTRLTFALLLLLFSATQICFGHKEWVHQHIARQGYEFLRVHVGEIPEMTNHLGFNEIGTHPWTTGKIVAGAYREDLEDPVFRYAANTPLGSPLISITHFWDAASEELDDRSEQKRTLSIRMRAGLKSSEDAFPGTRSGWALGIAIQLPVAEHWHFYPELNYWNAKSEEDFFSEDIVVKEYALAIGRTVLREPFLVDFAFGIGFGRATRTPRKNANLKAPDDRGFLSVNLEASLAKQLSNYLQLSLYLRSQRAGSLSSGGGDAYTPLLFGLGFEFHF